MSEANKQLALDFINHLTNGETSAAMELFADDATWCVAAAAGVGAHEAEHRGIKTKAEFLELLSWLYRQLPQGIHMAPKHVLDEGALVSVEAQSYTRTLAGKLYSHLYVFLFKIRDGKICQAREYFDRLHVPESFTWA